MENALARLEKAAQGLWVMSETDALLEVINLGPVDLEGFNTDKLIQLLKLPSDTPVETQEVPYFLRNMTTVRDGAREEKVKEAGRFRELERMLTSQLKEVKAYRIRQARIDAYLIGWSQDGQLCGLKTFQVET